MREEYEKIGLKYDSDSVKMTDAEINTLTLQFESNAISSSTRPYKKSNILTEILPDDIGTRKRKRIDTVDDTKLGTENISQPDPNICINSNNIKLNSINFETNNILESQKNSPAVILEIFFL